MAATPDDGAVAHHLIMALLADMAIHDDPRLQRMQEILSGIGRNSSDWHEQDVADLENAREVLRHLGSTPASYG